MSANIANDGKVTSLDGAATTDEVITAEDAKDSAKLARLLGRLLKDNAEARRRFTPRRLDFVDIAIGGSATSVSLAHGFGGRVRWWVVGWQSASVDPPYLREDTTATTANELVLLAYSAVVGTACIRVEQAG